MKKGMIITLIVAGALLVLGILLIITGLSLKSFHITKVFTEGGNMTERTVELQDKVEEVSVSDLHGASIDIVCADTAKVDVKEPKDYTFTITENAGKLSVTSEDHRGLFFRIPSCSKRMISVLAFLVTACIDMMSFLFRSVISCDVFSKLTSIMFLHRAVFVNDLYLIIQMMRDNAPGIYKCGKVGHRYVPCPT